MARSSKKGKLFQLFKNDFKITFFHKPSMLEDDIFYYIILDDIIKLKIKMIYGAIVIDDIIPLTTMYLIKEYETLINIFINQKDFTVLISLTGNTSAFSSVCMKVDAPIVEDPRFICISKNAYDNLREYYKDDISKYGFYLLSVKDTPEPNQQTNQDNNNPGIEAGKVPLIDKIMTKLQDKYKKSMEVITEYDTWKLGKILKISGIQFKLSYDEERKRIDLSDFLLDEMERYIDLMSIFEIFEGYSSSRVSIILHNNTNSNILLSICEVKGYPIMIPDDNNHSLSINQKYRQSVFGDYKIEKKHF